MFRPFTLAVRLFANMLAGHLLLAIFAAGTVYLLTVGNFSVIFAPVSFAMAVVMTFFELLVQVLQAYVFVVLTVGVHRTAPWRKRTEAAASPRPSA